VPGSRALLGDLPRDLRLDDEGLSHVTVDDVPAGLEAKVAEAADNCPERAITLS